MNQHTSEDPQIVLQELRAELYSVMNAVDNEKLRFHHHDGKGAMGRLKRERRQKADEDRRAHRELVRYIRLLQRSADMLHRYRHDKIRLEICRQFWKITLENTQKYACLLIDSHFLWRRQVTLKKRLEEIRATIRTAVKREQANGTRSPETSVDNAQQYVVGRNSASEERSHDLSAQDVPEKYS